MSCKWTSCNCKRWRWRRAIRRTPRSTPRSPITSARSPAITARKKNCRTRPRASNSSATTPRRMASPSAWRWSSCKWRSCSTPSPACSRPSACGGPPSPWRWSAWSCSPTASCRCSDGGAIPIRRRCAAPVGRVRHFLATCAHAEQKSSLLLFHETRRSSASITVRSTTMESRHARPEFRHELLHDRPRHRPRRRTGFAMPGRHIGLGRPIAGAGPLQPVGRRLLCRPARADRRQHQQRPRVHAQRRPEPRDAAARQGRDAVGRYPRPVARLLPLRQIYNPTVSGSGDANGLPLSGTATLNGNLKLDLAQLAYKWWLGHGNDVFGIGAGAAYYRAELSGTVNGSLNGVTGSASASTSDSTYAPLLELGWRHAFSSDVRLYADASGVKKSGGRVNGHIYGGDLGVEWFLAKNVGLTADYAVSKITINRDGDNSDNLDVRLSGPSVFLKVRF